jgi:hypothetical protein
MTALAAKSKLEDDITAAVKRRRSNQRLLDTMESTAEMAEVVRRKTSALVAVGSSLAAKTASDHPDLPVGPTPQRTALAEAANGMDAPSPRGGRAYRVRGPVDLYGPQFDMGEQSALTQLVVDAQAHIMCNVTSRYEGYTSKGSTGKLGGLGNVPQEIRERHARFQLFVAKYLHPKQVKALQLLVLEMPIDKDRPMSLSEIGNHFLPSIRDKATSKGISIGILMSIAWQAERFYRRERALTKQPVPPQQTQRRA